MQSWAFQEEKTAIKNQWYDSVITDIPYMNMNARDVEQLESAYLLCGIELHKLHERVSSLEDEIEHLKELLKLQQQRLFGKKSEASITQVEPEANNQDVNQSTGTIINVPAHTRKGRGPRQQDTSELPRHCQWP